MVALSKVAAALAAATEASGVAVPGRDDIGLELRARHETVTVTVTATTCPQPLTIGYSTVSVPAVTPGTTAITTSPTGTGGYGQPPVTLTTSTTTESVPETDTTPVVSSTSTEVYTTASSVSTVETTSSSSTRPIVTPSLPPAVGGAAKADVNAGLMVLMAIVALY